MNMFRWLFGRRSSEATPLETPLTQVPHEAFPPLPGERRHRHDVPYALPKDIMEGERLNLQHYLFRYTMKGNYAAPLDDNVVQILDIGSGTGIWGQEMARVTHPGGWIELLELGAAIIHPGPASEQLLNWARDFLARRGIDPLLTEKLPLIAQQVGLSKIQVRHLDIPLGGWDKHIGVLMEKDCLTVYRALKQGVCAYLGLSEATYDDMLDLTTKERKSNHSLYRFYLIDIEVQ
jgi:hypothetical protein